VKQFRTPYVFRWLFHRRLWGFSNADKTVYLTFDDGPTPECTAWILNTLSQYNAKATFFCVGANVKEHPELLKRICDEGHAIGNHTMYHENGNKTSKQAYLKSIEDAAALIPSSLFRPPYGRIPMTYTKALRKKYTIVMWSWLSYDYHLEVDATTILERAQSIRAGDILVLHDNTKSFDKLKVVLPKLLGLLEKKGFELAPISA
jgi:peptidoglycan/xylan/chitin deacetylase (PgdA/CDA1 family)